MKNRRRQPGTTPEAVSCRPPDHLRDEWANLSPEERLRRTLRLHRLRRDLLKLKK